MPLPASAANLDTIADRVFGQPDFTSGTANAGGPSASSLSYPAGVALDRAGNLYVADGNYRVLEYDEPLSTGAAADRVFGQPNFTSSSANNGGRSANSLSTPWDVDVLGTLYVADMGNRRVLAYDRPLTSGAAADRVFGQPNFTSGSANAGGLSASSLSSPFSVALDPRGSLFVADAGNHRVLVYDPALYSVALLLAVR